MSDAINFRDLAAQLRCPGGEHAAEVGMNMFRTNRNMILHTLDACGFAPGCRILEIGFGSGRHLDDIWARCPDASYLGIDISPAMVAEAAQHNPEATKSGRATFSHVAPGEIPDAGETPFDCCFTVNTIYFWDEPLPYLKKIFSRLKPGGRLVLSFVDKDFGSSLPFAPFGFTFYDNGRLRELLLEAGFTSVQISLHEEDTTGNDGRAVTRPFVVITAT